MAKKEKELSVAILEQPPVRVGKKRGRKSKAELAAIAEAQEVPFQISPAAVECTVPVEYNFEDKELNVETAIGDNIESGEFNELRWLTDIYEQAQKTRIGAENRLRALTQRKDEGPEMKFLTELNVKFNEIEKSVVKRMNKSIKLHPVYPWLSSVKGIGPTFATKLLGLIPNIHSFTTVSKLWRYSGLAVIDGKAERPTKGEKLHYNKRLKTTLYLIAGSMLKSNSPYRRVYDDAKNYYVATRTNRKDGEQDWTKAHIHMASLRKMEKVFMSHLWQTWREADELDVRALYVHEKLGHEMVYHREDFI